MKRFTETDKWTRDAWFCNLEPQHKLFWLYMIDHCDNVGVWEVNLKIANMLIGREYSPDELISVFGDKILLFDDGAKWWIKSFVNFQHGELSEESQSKPIISYIALLKKHTLWIPYTKGMQSVQGKGKGKGTGKGKGKEAEATEDFERVWAMYQRKGNKQTAIRYWNKLKEDDRKAIEATIPEYLLATPKEHYRNNFEGWINPTNRKWENKIVPSEEKTPANHKRVSEEKDLNEGWDV